MAFYKSRAKALTKRSTVRKKATAKRARATAPTVSAKRTRYSYAYPSMRRSYVPRLKLNSTSLGGPKQIVQRAVPSSSKSIPRKTIVNHREFVADVRTSDDDEGAFLVESYPINPGIMKTFPWCSQIAANYEEYKIKAMVFEYKTTSSDALNSTNTALGSVIMSTQYNVLSNQFINKNQMENYEHTTSGKPSLSNQHIVQCGKFETPAHDMFVRTNDTIVDNNSDLRLYDHGRFSIATVGGQHMDVVVGELWVSYEVELSKPRLNQAATSGISFHYRSGAGITAALPFKDAVLLSGTAPNFMSSAGTIDLPPALTGTFAISVNIYSTEASLWATYHGGWLINANSPHITPWPLFGGDVNNNYRFDSGDKGSAKTCFGCLDIFHSIGYGGSLAFKVPSTLPTGPWQVDLILTAMTNIIA